MEARDQRAQPFAGPLADRRLGSGGGDFAVVEWSDPGDGPWEWIAPLHVHHADDEAWYVLEGSLRFRLGDEEFEVGPGGGAFAPRGTPHAYGNARRKPARYLLITTPAILALVDELHAPHPEGEAPDYREIFARYDSELLPG
jgi:mannose-6-phosphate isomerase-like protein (cupin superfamily)